MVREFDERNMARSRERCAAMAEVANTGKRVLTERERAILDMWPRFEDTGDPVMVGDAYIDGSGDCNIIVAVRICDVCVDLVGEDGFLTGFKPGERVKRPAPKVLDADGVLIKVGDTVWHEDGSELHVIGFGDAQDGETMLVVEYAAGPTKWGEVRCLSVTHTRPDSWEQLEEDARKGACEYAGAYLKRDTIDSHECDGCRCDADGYGPTCEQRMALDIIRRAKKLAGVE